MLYHFQQLPFSRPDAGMPPLSLRRLPAFTRRAAWTAILLAFALLLWLDLAWQAGTAAIGYAVLIVVAAKMRLPLGLAGMTLASTALVWAAYAAAPAARGWGLLGPLAGTAILWTVAWACRAWVRERTVLEARLQTLAEARSDNARANAGLEHFASVVAHDLRGPLSTIALHTDLLAITLTHKDTDQAEAIGSIRKGIHDMKEMIDSLLESSRAQRGKHPATLADCNVQDVLCTVVDRLRATLHAAGAAVTWDPLPVAPADPTALSRVFQNLLENAIKYRGAAAPQVHVSAHEDADEWVFSVRDNGIGITPGQDLFEMFERGSSDKGLFEGTGIGLAVCKDIVERHGGRIWIHSHRGQGTIVRFSLPMRDVAATIQQTTLGAT
jgi:signal transduction histidine kinase